MLLPPLADRLTVPEGLRAYPRQPELADTPGDGGNPATATRTEAIAFVIETAGSYTLPAQSLQWWNTDTRSIETATTEAVTFEVSVAPGRAAVQAARSANPLVLFVAAALLLAFVAGLSALWHRRYRRMHARVIPERRLYRQLRKAVQREPVATIRPKLSLWLSAESSTDSAPGPLIESPLRQLERTAFGPEPPKAVTAARAELLSAIRDRRRAAHREFQRAPAALPGLNPDWQRPQHVEDGAEAKDVQLSSRTGIGHFPAPHRQSVSASD